MRMFRMKRMLSLCLILAIVLSLCACGNSTSEGPGGNATDASQQTGTAAENTEKVNEADETPAQTVSRLKCTFEDGSFGYIEDLTDTVTTEAFISQLPMDISLSDWAGREYYISRQLPYDEDDAQRTYAPGEFTYWCGGWITAYYDTDDDTVIEAGSVVIGMMDEIFLSQLKNAAGKSLSVRIEVEQLTDRARSE